MRLLATIWFISLAAPLRSRCLRDLLPTISLWKAMLLIKASTFVSTFVSNWDPATLPPHSDKGNAALLTHFVLHRALCIHSLVWYAHSFSKSFRMVSGHSLKYVCVCTRVWWGDGDWIEIQTELCQICEASRFFALFCFICGSVEFSYSLHYQPHILNIIHCTHESFLVSFTLGFDFSCVCTPGPSGVDEGCANNNHLKYHI